MGKWIRLRLVTERETAMKMNPKMKAKLKKIMPEMDEKYETPAMEKKEKQGGKNKKGCK